MSPPCMCKFGRLCHYFKVHSDEWTFPMCNLDFRIVVIVCVWIFVLFCSFFSLFLCMFDRHDRMWSWYTWTTRASTVHVCLNSPIFPQCPHLFLIMIENNSQICVKIFVFTWLNRIWNIHIIEIWYAYRVFPKMFMRCTFVLFRPFYQILTQ